MCHSKEQTSYLRHHNDDWNAKGGRKVEVMHCHVIRALSGVYQHQCVVNHSLRDGLNRILQVFFVTSNIEQSDHSMHIAG